MRPAVPVYCLCTPAEDRPFFRKPVSSTIRHRRGRRGVPRRRNAGRRGPHRHPSGRSAAAAASARVAYGPPVRPAASSSSAQSATDATGIRYLAQAGEHDWAGTFPETTTTGACATCPPSLRSSRPSSWPTGRWRRGVTIRSLRQRADRGRVLAVLTGPTPGADWRAGQAVHGAGDMALSPPAGQRAAAIAPSGDHIKAAPRGGWQSRAGLRPCRAGAQDRPGARRAARGR
ncbi:hypothetical protein T45_06608 [Streptomyces turgidiscabies]|nr:hypothetical protein T45_06608 [Streptomyces turgidiscabies]